MIEWAFFLAAWVALFSSGCLGWYLDVKGIKGPAMYYLLGEIPGFIFGFAAAILAL